MNRHVILAAVLAAASLASPALAADLPVKARYVAPVPVQDWSGVYVGIEGGYGWGHQSVNAVSPGECFDNCFIPVEIGALLIIDGAFINGGDPAFFPDVGVPSHKQRGWLFGGFAGVQKQWGGWVLGIEGDFDGANIKGSATSSATSLFDIASSSSAEPCTNCLALTQTNSIESKIDMLGSLRGKVGFALAPNWLIYGTGGLAFAHVKNAFTNSETVVDTSGIIGNSTFFSDSYSGGGTMLGWAAGAGIDWKFPLSPGSAVVFGVEYLHYQFPTHTITLNDNLVFNTVSLNTEERIDTVKARLSYLFSIH